MKTISPKQIFLLTAIAVLLTAGFTGTFRAEGKPDTAPKPMAVTGSMDWSIVPPNLPPYMLPGTDGDLYLRNMPLVGRFQLTG